MSVAISLFSYGNGNAVDRTSNVIQMLTLSQVTIYSVDRYTKVTASAGYLYMEVFTTTN